MTAELLQLEARRLLSASVSFNAGLLNVIGSNHADDIHVSVEFGNVIVHSDGSTVWSGSDVSRLVIRGGNGDDNITYNNERTQIDTRIYGDGGNDRIIARSFRAPGATVYGGNGDDSIRVENSLPGVNAGASVIYGENGSDLIETSNGAGSYGATVFGGNGSDRITATSWEHAPNGHVLYGENGDDVLRVVNVESLGPGHRLYGGNGSDHLFGSSGDDFFDGGKGRDVIHGGGGFDRAVRDRNDLLEEIEELI
jgi:Ca2+-binding RTX toxin-like protein